MTTTQSRRGSASEDVGEDQIRDGYASRSAGSDDRRVRALDGLRAVAVTLVVLFHVGVPGFDAGFLGVDVFFVISGFLITTLMVEEIVTSGVLSLPRFWARRVRRLLPGLAVLLVTVAIVEGAVAVPSELETLRADLVATTLYVANWHLISQNSYFSFTGFESPLQHAWSLAVEEQFYLVWPLVVAAVLVVSRRTVRALAIVAVAGVFISASLLAMLWAPGSVDRAYMGTLPRLFEPLIGAAGALLLLHPAWRVVFRRHALPLAILGAVGLGLGVGVISPSSSGYYRGGAFLVSIASLALVSSTWLGGARALGAVLSFPPLVWLGAVSYGIYLWHWPLTLWVGARDAGEGRPVRMIIACAATVGLAALSYYVVERPIRSRGRAGEGSPSGPRGTTRRTLASVPLVMVGVVSVSLLSTRVPEASPGAPTVILAGDSVPLRLSGAFEREAAELGWHVETATFGGCSVIGDTPIGPDGSQMSGTERCSLVVAGSQAELIDDVRPDVVVWWDHVSIASVLLPSGEQLDSGTAAFWRFRERSLRNAVDRLSAFGASVVFVAVEPPGIGIEQGCPEDGHGLCNEVWQRYLVEHYSDVTTRWNEVMRRFAMAHPALASFVSITDAVCGVDVAPCDDGIDGIPARPDGQHYEGEGESIAVEALLDALTPIVEEADALE